MLRVFRVHCLRHPYNAREAQSRYIKEGPTEERVANELPPDDRLGSGCGEKVNCDRANESQAERHPKISHDQPRPHRRGAFDGVVIKIT